MISFSSGERWNGPRDRIEFDLRVSRGAGRPDETFLCCVPAIVLEGCLTRLGLPAALGPSRARASRVVFQQLREALFEPVVERKLAAGAWSTSEGRRVIDIEIIDVA